LTLASLFCFSFLIFGIAPDTEACSKEKPKCGPASVLISDYIINKTVRNMSAGQTTYAKLVNAEIGDRLVFKIVVTNTGETTLAGMEVSDDLPWELFYINSSLWTNAPVAVSGADFFGPGLALGDLAPGQSVTLTFDADVISGADRTVANTIVAWGKKEEEKSSSAQVFIMRRQDNFNLNIIKGVRNLTSGQSSYFESVNAKNNDRLMFQIEIYNSGEAVLKNVFARDVLPSYVSYVSGTTRVDGSYVGDGLVSGGINVGSLNVGATKKITFEAIVNVWGLSGGQTLTNYAYVRADQVSERSDTASVYVAKQEAGYLNLYKYVRNLTTGQSSLASSANAKPGERVLFSIQLTAPAGQVNNARVWDALPPGLNYVSGTTRVDDSYYSDNLFSGGINLGTISSNQTKNVTFEATVASNISSQTLTNYAYATGDGIGQRQATAQVVVGQEITVPSTLIKKVANLSWPNGSDTSNQAYVNNTLQYTINYTNTTNTTLYNAKITDVLPSYTSLVSAANNGYYNSSQNQITWNLGTLNPNASISVSYQVKVIGVPQSGFIITNNALLTADNISVISNEVRTTVIVKGEVVKVITGGNDLTRNIGLSLIAALWTLVALYLLIEYGGFWRNLRLRLILYKIRLKDRLG